MREQVRGDEIREVIMLITFCALITSLLLPGLRERRAHFSVIEAQRNVRRLNLAIRLYVEEYDEAYPTYSSIWQSVTESERVENRRQAAAFRKLARGEKPTWFLAVIPYVATQGQAGVPVELITSPMADTGPATPSFGISQCLVYRCDPSSSEGYLFRKLSELDDLAATITLGDSGHTAMLTMPHLFHGYKDFYALDGDPWHSDRKYQREMPTRYSYLFELGAVYATADLRAGFRARQQMFYWPQHRGLPSERDRLIARCQIADIWAVTESERNAQRIAAEKGGLACPSRSR